MDTLAHLQGLSAPTILTIGYESATQPALVAALVEAGVEVLADVR